MSLALTCELCPLKAAVPFAFPFSVMSLMLGFGLYPVKPEPVPETKTTSTAAYL